MARQTEIIEHDDGAYSGPSLARMPQGGGQLVSEKSLFGEVVMAQPTRAPRDEARIMQRIDTMAAAAGEAWFYRFPVKKRGGGIDYIEGPSIDCTDAVARYYGNCRVDCAVVDTGPAWIIYGRFIDLETGYTLIRPFLQSKAGSKLGGDDDERRIQIAMAIGTSKSQRNVVDHALKDFTSRAFEGAKQNLVKRVGLKLPEYRERCVNRLGELGADMLARVERVYQRKAAEWLAPDVARIIAELRAVHDGMATIDETWPPPPPPEPKAPAEPATPADEPKVAEATGEARRSSDAQAQPAEAARDNKEINYRIENALGEAAFIKAMENLLSEAPVALAIAKIFADNFERYNKLSAAKRQALTEKGVQRQKDLDDADAK